jgi:CBS domain-containing protein
VKEEESDNNVAFVPRTSSVDAAFQLFSDHPLLEATLITNVGRKAETPLGIITRWDVVVTGRR